MEADKYLGLFIDESKENLQKLNENLLSLEEKPNDLEVLNDIFRVAHTFKGMSRTMGFNDLADLTHHMENILDPLRSGKLQSSSDVIDILFKCLDKIEEMVDLIINGNYMDNKNKIDDIITQLQELENKCETGTPSASKQQEIVFNEYEVNALKQGIADGLKAVELSVSVTDECLLHGVRAYMVVSALESKGDLIKAVPEAEELEKGEFEKSFNLYVLTSGDEAELSDVASNIMEIESVKLKVLTPEDLDKTEDKTEQKAEIEDSDADNIEDAKQQSVVKVVPQTIRVNADRLDKLMNLVGELVINRTRISQLSNEAQLNELSSVISLLGNITTDIQEIVMKLRMVPIEQVFNRFPRLIRDISKKQGKEINLSITGKDTEIDRVVIDEIGDPLIHLIRNSLDHGLEMPEVRINAGKPSKGTLELSAFNEGDNIIIKVSDDGKGIDPEHIKKIAIKKDIITAEAAKNLSEKESLELIFAPGFSTAEVATDISGRGVGMDVVKSKVNSLGGNVSITSKVGTGTTITINLPSTMAIVQSLLIKVGEEIYATPLNYISEVIDVKPEEVKNVQNKEVIVLRGQTLPLIRLSQLLDVDLGLDTEQPLTVMIVKSQNRQIGVIVSELIGQQEVVIKPIEKKLCSENYISGATTLGNGKVALIINVNALF